MAPKMWPEYISLADAARDGYTVTEMSLSDVAVRCKNPRGLAGRSTSSCMAHRSHPWPVLDSPTALQLTLGSAGRYAKPYPCTVQAILGHPLARCDAASVDLQRMLSSFAGLLCTTEGLKRPALDLSAGSAEDAFADVYIVQEHDALVVSHGGPIDCIPLSPALATAYRAGRASSDRTT